MDFYKRTTITVEGYDDLLTEILLRLPSKSIFKFTCVSTRWNNLITDNDFRKFYSERTRRSLACSYPRGRLLALVQTNNQGGGRIPFPLTMIHNLMPVRGEENVSGAHCGSDFFAVKDGYFITSSSDGIFLCGLIPKIYYVGNPITGRWETLPPPPPPEGFPDNSISVGLSSNKEDDALGGSITNFRVIIATGGRDHYKCLVAPGRDVIPIETYSSKTREWRRSRLISEVPVRISSEPPTFSGGYFHWLTTDGRNIVAFDPSSLEEEDNHSRGLVPKRQKQHVVQVFKTPLCHGSIIVWRSGNGQTMWFGISVFDRGVEVFRKRDESDEWACVSSTGSTDTMTKDILGITQKDIDKELALSMGYSFSEEQREMAWLIAFIPWNPRLVMMWYWDRVYVYDCIEKKLDREVILDGDRHFSTDGWHWYPYFHTLSKSPYNLKYDRQPCNI